MPRSATLQLSSRRDKTGKVASGSRYFEDPKHKKNKVLVVISIEYKNSFLVQFMSEDKKLEKPPRSFSRKQLNERLIQAENGVVEIVIDGVVGHVKKVCLKQFLDNTLNINI
ncbi:MAG: hypothetical protein A2937_02295 [Candidatus Yonathbacteria bacterium RIFCSPLOWO2_01_FULL_47_33b]|uniref:Uncharacterized protein n=1 Tax=Candidatus Yonathbacteria bacterium RIFCSPLOWO2_01_FULL_47_33b TaxID=1802727 RepID=A0A1G2SD80_9BACT|nr:MAG: hypothetical protein A2937_02295 [Candidatus Yonathbacteria bacterium RIFCSPLOWO2_01_FULL_47_33b]